MGSHPLERCLKDQGNQLRERPFAMIDLHSHLLPNLDDGPRTLEDSIQMCRISYQDGIKTIVATPHNLPGIYKNDRSKILSKVHELNEAIKRLGVGIQTPNSELSLKILPGADVHFSSDI